MGNKQLKKTKASQQAESQRSKSADVYRSGQNNSVYGVKLVQPVDPIQQMKRSQQNSMNMLNQSQLGRSASHNVKTNQSKIGSQTQIPKNGESQLGAPVSYQKIEILRSKQNSVISRANNGQQQRNQQYSHQNSKMDISRAESKRNVSPNKPFSSSKEVSVILSNIRKKVIQQI